jgi:hypothetical protein
MVDEWMVPLLPCASVDEIRDFYLPLGFEVTYRQMRPNPYLALKREGIDLHYFGIDGFKPEDSYGTCLVVVKDTEPLFEAFAAGLRAQFGKLPMTGYPRITRPRRRKNSGNLSGFSLVDPAGNWIRVTVDSNIVAPEDTPKSKLSADLDNAVVFADSKGDVPAAIRVLERGLRRIEPSVSSIERLEATVYLAELLIRGSEPDRAAVILAQVRDSAPHVESKEASSLLRQATELEATLALDP